MALRLSSGVPALLRALVAVTAILLAGDPASSAEPAQGTVSAAIRENLQGPSDGSTDFADREAMRTFYETRGFSALWVSEAGLTPSGARVVEELANAEQWGLDGGAFQTAAASRPLIDGRWTIIEAAAADVEVSGLVLKYARHARGGRIAEPEKLLTTYLDRAPRLAEPTTIMTDVWQAGDPAAALRAYHPKHPQFLRLKEYYAQLKAEQKRQQDMMIPARGPVLLPSKAHPDIAVLRRRFAIAADAGAEDIYDERLVSAVKQFQATMSLRADGIVGKATRKALNINVTDKITAVASNIEQWRWMPDELGPTYIFVNVPSYTVDFVKDGATTFSERVIVGKETTQTPIFSHNMTTIVMRPEWYLPDSIKLKKLLSGRALESQGLRVKKNGRVVNSSKVNWSKANLSAYSVYQPSGGGNALGAVKFLFPNKHSVYLHDTPDKSLFNESDRNFSAGCVRVRNPLTLAQHIFDADLGVGAIDVSKLARSGPESNEITLQKPLPVHIAHFTVWIDDHGGAKFFGDKYGHQKRITLALNDRWREIDRGKDHLAALDTTALQGISLRSRRALPTPLTGPAGLFSSNPKYSYGSYRSSGGGVGEMIRRAFGN